MMKTSKSGRISRIRDFTKGLLGGMTIGLGIVTAVHATGIELEQLARNKAISEYASFVQPIQQTELQRNKSSQQQNRETLEQEVFYSSTPKIPTTNPLQGYNPSRTIVVGNVIDNKPDRYSPQYTLDDNFASDDEAVLFARTLLGECSGEYRNDVYLNLVAKTITNRAEKSGKSIRDIVLASRKKTVRNGKTTKVIDVFAYSCFDPSQGLLPKLRDPLNYEREESWNSCYDTAEKAVHNMGQLPAGCEGVTNYFVGGDPFLYRTKKEAEAHEIPSWAYDMNDKGIFVLDTQKRRIPRNPVAVVPVKGGNGKAYFYSFSSF